MVQAEYVTSAIRTLITGGSANPSTNAARTAYECTLPRAVEGMARRVA